MSEDFFAEHADLGVSRAKPTASGRLEPAQRFLLAAAKETTAIQRGDRKGNWFYRPGDDTVVVTLRNGKVPMNAVKPEFVCRDGEAACTYLRKATEAATDGRFDEIFHAHEVKRLDKRAAGAQA